MTQLQTNPRPGADDDACLHCDLTRTLAAVSHVSAQAGPRASTRFFTDDKVAVGCCIFFPAAAVLVLCAAVLFCAAVLCAQI